VPQFLLDDPTVGPTCSIVCTQPRRISAISVAERIAQVCRAAGGGSVIDSLLLLLLLLLEGSVLL
jgi:ATP-dependent RNA helicase DHX36